MTPTVVIKMGSKIVAESECFQYSQTAYTQIVTLVCERVYIVAPFSWASEMTAELYDANGTLCFRLIRARLHSHAKRACGLTTNVRWELQGIRDDDFKSNGLTELISAIK